ncbi:MAG TPA: hypothetical protein VIX73_04750 [Kofleriaceae bacterium]
MTGRTAHCKRCRRHVNVRDDGCFVAHSNFPIKTCSNSSKPSGLPAIALAGALKCGLCDTVLQTELPDGRVMQFTKHTAEFCRDLTIHRIAGLQRAVQSTVETIKHKVEHHIRVVDEALEQAGAKTFKTRAAEAELRAQVAKELDMLPIPELFR